MGSYLSFSNGQFPKKITEIKEMDCTMRPFLMLEASDYCSFNSILSIAGNIDSRFQIFIEFLPSESIAS